MSEASTPKRFLVFRNWRTGEESTRVEVTGRSEREIERIERGMLINIGDDWMVDDVTESASALKEETRRDG